MSSTPFTLRPRYAGALIALLAATACGGSSATGTATQPVTAGAPATQAVAEADAPRRHHDPAQMVEHFDANHDGALQLTELPPRMQQHMAAADTDHDGTLSPAELTAFRQAREQERFARLDANGDGAITADEAGAERWAFLSRADADHDGRLTRAELDRARASGAMRGAHGFRGGPGAMHGGGFDPARMIARFDANHDGALQLTELPPRMQQRLGAADANHDGALSADEISAAFAQR